MKSVSTQPERWFKRQRADRAEATRQWMHYEAFAQDFLAAVHRLGEAADKFMTAIGPMRRESRKDKP